MGDCEGAHVGLFFDPTHSAAAPGSLAGPLLRGPMRTRRANACRGDVSTTTLMFEDGAASHVLQDEDDGPVVVADLLSAVRADCGATAAYVCRPCRHGRLLRLPREVGDRSRCRV